MAHKANTSSETAVSTPMATALRTMASVSVLWAAGGALALAADQHSRKGLMPAKLAAGPSAVTEDVGDVAVIVDNGVIVTPRNPFDLPSPVTLRFEPAGDHSYSVSLRPGVLDPSFGPELKFGFPGTIFPGDDDTEQVSFPAGFPFFGATHTSMFVNTDGNISFREPDFASSARDKARHVLGPPRVSGFLHDWNPKNAFNPAGTGSIHAALKTEPDRLVVTWNGVADFEGGLSNTFQITLYSSGAVEVTLDAIEAASSNGVVGIAEGDGQGPIQNVDFTAALPPTLAAGAIVEAFSQLTRVSDQAVAREFYKTHLDKFDFLIVLTDFPAAGFFHSVYVSNQTHGIGTPLGSTVYDFTSAFGSGGELEQMAFMNNIHLFSPNAGLLADPPIEPYRAGSNILLLTSEFGGPVSLDGQTMSQIRVWGTMPGDDGEFSGFFGRGGSYSMRLYSPMSVLAQEVEHRWAMYLRFVHPTKGVGFDSFDLLGRQTAHWSYFVNTGVPSGQFGTGQRSSAMEGNAILDLGPLSDFNGTPVSLDSGENVFVTPADQLLDGYSALDQHLMGLRRAGDVGPFFYVDEPKSIFTGQSLDQFDPFNPLNTAVTMRGWSPMGGIAFKGRRVDLTIENVQHFEKIREGSDNPRGRRFWGPKGNLTVRYFSDTRRVDPNGDASVVLSIGDRELGDEADRIDDDGKPVDVKTTAFILVVQAGAPAAHATAISRVDGFRRAWEAYANGPATGGRGKFDTRLDPPCY